MEMQQRWPEQAEKIAIVSENPVLPTSSDSHPSGSTNPSRADEHLTNTLKQAAALVDVRVLGHFIVAGGSVRSMAEMGFV
jgi:hypothetical protein